MRIIETEIYTFDELSEDAKENAKIELVSESIFGQVKQREVYMRLPKK